MHEQRTADAAIASPPDDPTDARSEAPLLELSPIPVWPPEKAVSVPSLGFGIAHVRLLDTASICPSRLDARTVNYSDSCVRQSRMRRGIGGADWVSCANWGGVGYRKILV